MAVRWSIAWGGLFAGLVAGGCGAPPPEPPPPVASAPRLPAEPRTPGEPAPGALRLQISRVVSTADDVSFCGPDTVLVIQGSARLWDVSPSRQRAVLPGFHRAGACSRDGRRVVTGGERITVWDAATAAPVRDWEAPEQRVVGLAVSPDGSMIAAGSPKSGVTLWDADSGSAVVTIGEGETRAVAFSPDGSALATVGEDGQVVVWDARTGQVRQRLRHPATRVLVEFVPDGEGLVTMSDDGLHFWSLDAGRRVRTLDLHSPGLPAVDFALSPDGTRAVITRNVKRGEPVAVVLDLATGEPLVEVSRPLTADHVAFSPDGARIASSAVEHVDVWDAATGATVGTAIGRARSFQQFSWSDGRFVATRPALGTTPMMIWDLRDERPAIRDEVPIHGASIDPSGHCLTSAVGEVWVWNAGCTQRVRSIGLPGGRALAERSSRGCVLIMQRSRGDFVELQTDGDCGALDPPWGATGIGGFSDDGRRLLVFYPGPVLFDVDQGVLPLTAPAQGVVPSRLVSPDGRLVAGSTAGTSWVWDVTTGEVRGRVDDPDLVDVSSDGRWLLAGNATLGVHDVATGERRASFEVPGPRRWAGFVSGGQRVLTASDEGVLVWDPQTGRQLAELVWFPDDTWLVHDAEGRFDCSERAPIAVTWAAPDGRLLGVEEVRATHHDPGLLSKILGYRDGPLRDLPRPIASEEEP